MKSYRYKLLPPDDATEPHTIEIIGGDIPYLWVGSKTGFWGTLDNTVTLRRIGYALLKAVETREKTRQREARR
jgi:hypothetical protein